MYMAKIFACRHERNNRATNQKQRPLCSPCRPRPAAPRVSLHPMSLRPSPRPANLLRQALRRAFPQRRRLDAFCLGSFRRDLTSSSARAWIARPKRTSFAAGRS